MSALAPTVASDLIRQLSSALAATRDVLEQAGVDETAARLATYAWDGTWSGNDNNLLDALSELSTAAEATRGMFMLPDGSELYSQEEAANLLLLQTAATARRELNEGESIRVEDLAALAGIAEKTVRMATNPKSSNPLQVTKQGHWTLITASDALAWLERRGDFKPTRMDTATPLLTTLSDLAEAIKERMARLGKTLQATAREVHFNKSTAAALEKLLASPTESDGTGLKPSQLKALADVLEFGDPVAFATKAYQLLAIAAADREIQRELRPR